MIFLPITILNRHKYKYYQDSVEELRTIFKKLNLVMDGTPAIRFADPEILRVLTTEKAFIDYPNPSTGIKALVDRNEDGMIDYTEAASVQSLSPSNDRAYSIFRNNTEIEIFNEFQYFTGLKNIPSQAFGGCTSLHEITLPPAITSIEGWAFLNTKIKYLIIPEGVTTLKDNVFQSCAALQMIDLPSTTIELGDAWFRECKSSIICRAITPPTLIRWGYNAEPGDIYVPDASLNAYKTATNWSIYAARIRPLSTYVE